MKTNRPKIKVPWEPLDVIVDLISATLFILIIVYTLLNYDSLSETIPTHFNAEGVADGYGKKYHVWLLPILGISMFILLFIINKYPHLHNHMVNITEENALRNYRFSSRVVRFTNFFVALIFAVIQYVTIQQATGHDTQLTEWFMPLIIGTSLLIPIVILLYYRKLNKS